MVDFQFIQEKFSIGREGVVIRTVQSTVQGASQHSVSRAMYSTLVMKGNDGDDTAMSRLVGLPMGVFVKLVMEGRITSKGVNIPVMQEVYDPVLEELKDYGVVFTEREVIL